MLKEGLGALRRLVMGFPSGIREEGKEMADDESILTNPPTPDAAVHVRDYLRFTKLLTIGTAVCFVIAMFVLIIL